MKVKQSSAPWFGKSGHFSGEQKARISFLQSGGNQMVEAVELDPQLTCSDLLLSR